MTVLFIGRFSIDVGLIVNNTTFALTHLGLFAGFRWLEFIGEL